MFNPHYNQRIDDKKKLEIIITNEMLVTKYAIIKC